MVVRRGGWVTMCVCLCVRGGGVSRICDMYVITRHKPVGHILPVETHTVHSSSDKHVTFLRQVNQSRMVKQLTFQLSTSRQLNLQSTKLLIESSRVCF